MRAQRSRFLVVSQGLGPAAKPPRKHNNNNVIILYIVHCPTAAAPEFVRAVQVRHRNEPRPRYYILRLSWYIIATLQYGAAVVVEIAAADIFVVIVIIIITRRV